MMLARSLSRASSTPSARHASRLVGGRTSVSSLIETFSTLSWAPGALQNSDVLVRRAAVSGRRCVAASPYSVLQQQQQKLTRLPQQQNKRSISSSPNMRSKPPLGGEDENDVDVTPVGDKPWQITADAIAEAEAAKALGDDEDIGEAGAEGDDSSEWEYDNPTESLEANKAGEDGDAPPTPILDAYERSRDPVEMERLIAMSFDSLPERAGPQRYNHKRREQQRYKTIRKIKYKEKTQRMLAHERKLQKTRDRKARELALFATWRVAGSTATDARQ